VGCVGLREHRAAIEQLRAALPRHIYLWINAYKSQGDNYDEALVDAFRQIDPLFPINNTRHASRGRTCRTGRDVFTVDGDGWIRRCHFVDRVLDNLYAANFEQHLVPAPCPNETCGCHIGHVHLEHLKLYQTFGDGVLERVPAGYTTADV